MFKFCFFFNVLCIVLAIRSALSAEVPDPNEQKVRNYLTSSKDGDEVSKRAAAMWFGPRLGKRTIPLELHDDLLEEVDDNPLFYSGESPQQLAAEIAQGAPYAIILFTGQRTPAKSQPVFYHSSTPRLGRRDASANENNSRPPFAPRLGRNLPFSPRLGRSFSGSSDSMGY